MRFQGGRGLPGGITQGQGPAANELVCKGRTTTGVIAVAGCVRNVSDLLRSSCSGPLGNSARSWRREYPVLGIDPLACTCAPRLPAEGFLHLVQPFLVGDS